MRRPSGVPALDEALGGGWPQGRVCELVGALSCGRASVAASTLAAATARGEVAAWIDGADAFDPASAAAAGVGLDRVLWVRPRGVGETVRVAEVVLETGGFAVVVLDFTGGRTLSRGGDVAAAARGADRHGPLRLRLARAVERSGAVALVLAERPWAGASAAVTVQLAAARPVWLTGGYTDGDTGERRGQWSVVGGQSSHAFTEAGVGGESAHGPRPTAHAVVPWLAGLDLSFSLQRGAARPVPLADRAEGF